MKDHLLQQTVELAIEGLTANGAGVGRHDGLAVFVQGALPGEIVQARISQLKKNYAHGELLEILQPSPSRYNPACPHYEECGGCLLQHLDYQEQLRWKRQWLVDTLWRIGGIETEVLPTLASEQIFAYRNRVQLHVFRQAGQLSLGFYGRGGQVGAECLSCMLMQPILAGLSQLLSGLLARETPKLAGLQHVALRCDDEGQRAGLVLVGLPFSERLQVVAEWLMGLEPRLQGVWANWGRPVYGIYGKNWQKLAGTDKLRQNLGSLELEISPAAFTQVNSLQTQRLYEQVSAYAGLSGRDVLLDVYSGVGMIALYLAGQARQVVGVEEYEPAVADAIENARLNKVMNCSFEAGRAEIVLPRLAAEGFRADVAVLDPPRAGCAAVALTALAELAPQRLVYVSCDPATLARDARLLIELGYEVQEAQPLDMFPHSGHVETVVLFIRQQD